jgi:hypothetical protein
MGCHEVCLEEVAIVKFGLYLALELLICHCCPLLYFSLVRVLLAQVSSHSL